MISASSKGPEVNAKADQRNAMDNQITDTVRTKADRIGEEPMEKPMEKPMEESVEEPMGEQLVEKLMEELMERPMDERDKSAKRKKEMDEGTLYYMAHYVSPVGKLTLASDGSSLVGLWIDGQKYFAASIHGEMVEKEDIPVFAVVKKWLDQYFSGEKPDIGELPLAPGGSAFRQQVWKLLCEIPYGTLVTYGALAKMMAEKMGRPTMSAQAVGGAVSHNPISVIIPCHRVVGTGGSLTGYAGGIDKKIWLLEHEGVDLSSLT